MLIYPICRRGIYLRGKGKAKIEFWENDVTRSGNGAHVFVPVDWLGKRVRVMVIDDKEDKDKNKPVKKKRND